MLFRTAAVVATLVFSTAACSKNSDSSKAGKPESPSAEGDTETAQKEEMPPGHPPQNPHGGESPHGGASPHGGMPAAHGEGGGAQAEVGDDGTLTLGPIAMKAPDSWKSVTPKSQMRAAQFEIPGDAGAAELVVYYFGSGGAGTVEANLERWYSQFQQPDGAKAAEKAKTDKREISGVPVTTTDVSGRFVARMRPGAEKRHDKAAYRMLAAILETDNGPYYLKLVGPEKTVAAAKKPFDDMIESIEKK